MQKRKIAGGRTVGVIGFGAWSFGDAYGPADDAQSLRTLARALELGVDFWDTANVYGNGRSESLIGRFFRESKAARGKVCLATKGGITRPPGSTQRTFDNSPAHLREALEASLRRLATEHVELYYIHRREPSRPIEEVVETLVRFKQEGKIGGFGFSEIAPSSLRRAHAVHPVTAVQSEYSLWTRLPELGMIQATAELGVTFVPFSPLGRGMLTGRVTGTDGFGPLDFRKHNPRFLEPNFTANRRALGPFFELARARGLAPATLALAWVAAKGEHLLAIPGTRTVDHLEENARAGDIVLSAAEVAQIERILPVGFAHGDRYSDAQNVGQERYC